MWKRSENIVHRLFSRQVSRGPPNAHLHRARGFYENVVPSHTVYEVDCPDQWWRRFTNDGQYLVCFSRSSRDLLLYRPLWLSYHSKSEFNDELPASAGRFESHFSLVHRVPLATTVNEVICKDFFLCTENNVYGIFATSTAPDAIAPTVADAAAGVPCIEKITFLLVRLADGVITARSVFQDDYIHLSHNGGVFLHDDLLAILSVRFQRIHILQIRDEGLFLDIRTIGEFCREDDELLLNSQAQVDSLPSPREEARYQGRKARGTATSSETSATVRAGPPPAAATTEFWGSQPWGALRPEHPAPRGETSEPVVAPGEIDSLYEGYFRGFFPDTTAQHRVRNLHVWRFEESERVAAAGAERHLLLGGEYSSYEEAFAQRSVDSNPSGTSEAAPDGRGESSADIWTVGSSSHSTSSTNDAGALGLSSAAVQHPPGPNLEGEEYDPGDVGVQEVSLPSGQMLGGLKQRLMSFILQCIQNDDTSPAIKAQRLKRYYYHFQQYMDLVMWKVQFLDRCHLLIKFGSTDGLVSRNAEASNHIAFLAVYNMETTEMLAFYQNSSEELLQCVERYCDHFRMAPQYPLYMNFISSFSNNSFAREQLQKQKAASVNSKVGTYSQVVKRTLASLPHTSQSHSPSPYFDQYLFHYDEKLISATDRHKPCMEHPIKFISRRRPNTLKFKINPGTELGSNDGHIKRIASFVFHPIYPFAISVQQSFMQTTIVNFHFRK